MVDLDEGCRQLLDTFLRIHCAQVRCCNDEKYAYPKTAGQVFDCIVIDIHKPIIGGLELLSKIRQVLTCDTPMILISGEAGFTQSELTYKQA
ncbi:MAG: CheY-like chemotaxis protein [Paraglaciecola sp.]|jgi:CheY-like chemotaxis protein